MVETMIISIIVSVVLGVLLWDRHMEYRKLASEMQQQKETNKELLKRIPITGEGKTTMEPLAVEKIADAIRFEGYFPETEEDCVRFKVQGESYLVDASRLPLLFVIKGYSVDPNEWDMGILRDAAHIMSDRLVMVKATFSADDKDLRFFVAARDRNSESFRSNLTSYLSIIEDGQRVMNEEYNRMVKEQRDDALKGHPTASPVKQENKLLS